MENDIEVEDEGRKQAVKIAKELGLAAYVRRDEDIHCSQILIHSFVLVCPRSCYANLWPK